MAVRSTGPASELAARLLVDGAAVMALSLMAGAFRRFARFSSSPTDRRKAWTWPAVMFYVASTLVRTLPLFLDGRERTYQAVSAWRRVSQSPQARAMARDSSSGTGMVTVALNAYLGTPAIHDVVHDVLVTAAALVVLVRWLTWQPAVRESQKEDEGGPDTNATPSTSTATDNDNDNDTNSNTQTAVGSSGVTQFKHAVVASLFTLAAFGAALTYVGWREVDMTLSAWCLLASGALAVGAACAHVMGCVVRCWSTSLFLLAQATQYGLTVGLWVTTRDVAGRWDLGLSSAHAVDAAMMAMVLVVAALYGLSLLVVMSWKPWLAAVAVGLGACTAMLPRDIAVQLGAAANVGGIMGFVISGGGMGIAALALVGSGVTRLYPVHSHGGFRA